MGKALEAWQIEKIKEEKAAGATYLQLAQKYKVHHKTIENYCLGLRKKETESYNLSIISTTPGKRLNLHDITKYEHSKDGRVKFWRGNTMVADLNNDKIFGILLNEGG